MSASQRTSHDNQSWFKGFDRRPSDGPSRLRVTGSGQCTAVDTEAEAVNQDHQIIRPNRCTKSEAPAHDDRYTPKKTLKQSTIIDIRIAEVRTARMSPDCNCDRSRRHGSAMKTDMNTSDMNTATYVARDLVNLHSGDALPRRNICYGTTTHSTRAWASVDIYPCEKRDGSWMAVDANRNTAKPRRGRAA